MARIRSIKPDFQLDESIGRVSRDARLLFVLLQPQCDDHGKVRAASRILASLLFPSDDDAPGLIEGWLDELEREGLILRYQVDGKNYLMVENWKEYQRVDKPSASNLPDPQEHSRAFANARDPSRTLPLGKDRIGEEGRGNAREARARGSAGHERAETALPSGWSPSTADREWAKAERPDLDDAAIDEQTARFRNQASAKGWRNVDWSASWRNWILGARAATAKGHPAGEGATVREPLRLTGAETRGTLLLRGHRPGGTWPAANGPAPESDQDNSLLDPGQRRQWRRYHGLPATWAGLQRAEAGP